jgi:hypothetical protein
MRDQLAESRSRILCIGDVDFVLLTLSRYFHDQNKFDLCD